MSQTKEAYLRRKEEAAKENCRMYLETGDRPRYAVSPLFTSMVMVLFQEDQDRPLEPPHPSSLGGVMLDERLEIPDISMKTP